MKVRAKPADNPCGIPLSVTLGALMSSSLTLIGAAVSAYLMVTETVGEGAAVYCSLITLLLAAFAGASLSAWKAKRLRLQVCLLSAAIYYLMLLATTALFFGGQYENMGATALVVLVGSGIAVLPSVLHAKGRKVPIRKKAYR